MEDMTLGKMTRDQLEAQLKSVKDQLSVLNGSATLLTNELARDCLEGASVESRVEANADIRTPMVTVTCFREPYKGRSVRFNAYRAFEDRSILTQDLCKAMPGVRIIPNELRNRVEEECVKVVMRDISLRVSKKDVPWLDVAREELDRAIAKSVLMDNARDNRYLVVKDGEDGAYGVRTLFDGETWSVEIDALDGSKVTCIKDRNKNTVDTAGEAVEEFDSIKDARVCAGRMSRIHEVMEG